MRTVRLCCLLLALAALTLLAGGPVRAGGGPTAPVLEPVLQLGHTHRVVAVAFSPSGDRIATGSDDGTVKVWDTRTLQLRWTLSPSPPSRVRALSFSSDGALLAAGGPDMGPHVWDLRSGRQTHLLYHSGVTGIAFSGARTPLAVAGAGQLAVWTSLETVKPARHWIAPDGSGPDRGLAVAGDGSLIAAAAAAGIYLWPAHDEAPRLIPSEAADGVALSPDRRWVAAGCRDGRVRLWPVDRQVPPQILPSIADAIPALAFSPDASRLWWAGRERGELWSWDVRSDAAPGKLGAHPGGVNGLALSPDGRLLVSAGEDASVRLWDARTGDALGVLGGVMAGEGAVAFSPDGRHLAVGGGRTVGTVNIWRADTGELHRVLPAQPEGVEAVAFSADGELLASGGGELTRGEVRVWEARSGVLRHTFPGHYGTVRSVAFSPDGRLLACGSYREIRIRDSHSGVLIRTLPAHEHWVTGLAFSPDGRLLASASADRSVKVWDAADGRLLRTTSGHRDWVACLTFSPDGKSLATGGWDDTIRFWDPETGAEQWSIQGKARWYLSLAYSPDGKTLAAGTSKRTVYADDQPELNRLGPPEPWVQLWDLGTRTLQGQLYGHRSDVVSVAFAPRGPLLASWSSDVSVHLWDAAKREARASLVHLPAPHLERPIPADSRPIAADSRPLRQGSPPLPPGGEEAGRHTQDYLVLLPGGYYASSAAGDRYMRFRLASDLFPAECFQARYRRPDIVRQSLAGRSLPPAPRLKGAYPPVVRVLSPAAGDAPSGEKIHLLVEVTDDSDVRQLDLFVDGRCVEAHADRGEVRSLSGVPASVTRDGMERPAAHRVARRFRAVVPLPRARGAARVHLVAVDDDGLRSPREELLLSPRSSTAPGRMLSLCVGISSFARPELNLRFADRDALALGRALQQQDALYTSTNAVTLTNQSAGQSAIRRRLSALAEQAGPADTVVLFFATHGWRSDAGELYLATHETDSRRIRETALPWSEVLGHLKRLSGRTRRVLVLLDACHSGSAATNEDLVRSALEANAGVVVFTSSRAGEVSLESPESGHGNFTQALLDALGGRAASGGRKHTSMWELVSYVRNRVREVTGGAQNPQVPFLQDFDTDAPILSHR